MPCSILRQLEHPTAATAHHQSMKACHLRQSLHLNVLIGKIQLPLTYEFQLEDEPISYGSSPKSVSTGLPAGSPEDDYQLQINIVIKNAVGVAVVINLVVKVSRMLSNYLFF